MTYEDYETKDSVVIVYTGDGKGKTTASLGLMGRALGAGKKVAYIQFIKHWEVNEHKFVHRIQHVFEDNLFMYRGGEGFYRAGKLSAKGISDKQHKDAAKNTYNVAYDAATEGDYDLVICDEINNAVHDGLLAEKQIKKLVENRAKKTSLCLTGRDFPKKLLPKIDIATDMKKLRHHYDDKFLANEGIDY